MGWETLTLMSQLVNGRIEPPGGLGGGHFDTGSRQREIPIEGERHGFPQGQRTDRGLRKLLRGSEGHPQREGEGEHQAPFAASPWRRTSAIQATSASASGGLSSVSRRSIKATALSETKSASLAGSHFRTSPRFMASASIASSFARCREYRGWHILWRRALW